MHRLNDEGGAEDPMPGQQLTLHWAAEHSYVVGSEAGSAEIAGADEATGTTETAGATSS